MNERERKLILKYRQSDKNIARLYSEHQDLESKLLNFAKHKVLSTHDQFEEKRLKRKKLQGVDMMMAALRQKREVA